MVAFLYDNGLIEGFLTIPQSAVADSPLYTKGPRKKRNNRPIGGLLGITSN